MANALRARKGRGRTTTERGGESGGEPVGRSACWSNREQRAGRECREGGSRSSRGSIEKWQEKEREKLGQPLDRYMRERERDGALGRDFDNGESSFSGVVIVV